MLQIQCTCGNLVETYSHATSIVKCPKCNKDLMIPTAGKAQKTKAAQKIRVLGE